MCPIGGGVNTSWKKPVKEKSLFQRETGRGMPCAGWRGRDSGSQTTGARSWMLNEYLLWGGTSELLSLWGGERGKRPGKRKKHGFIYYPTPGSLRRLTMLCPEKPDCNASQVYYFLQKYCMAIKHILIPNYGFLFPLQPSLFLPPFIQSWSSSVH